jgi:hypothetical protein
MMVEILLCMVSHDCANFPSEDTEDHNYHAQSIIISWTNIMREQVTPSYTASLMHNPIKV